MQVNQQTNDLVNTTPSVLQEPIQEPQPQAVSTNPQEAWQTRLKNSTALDGAAEFLNAIEASEPKAPQPLEEGTRLQAADFPQEPEPAPAQADTGKGGKNPVYRGFRNLMAGLEELPRATVNGVTSMLSETADLVYQVGSLYTRIPDAAFGTHLEEDKNKFFPKIPEWKPLDDPKSQLGKIEQSVVQFVSGFALPGGAVGKGISKVPAIAKVATTATRATKLAKTAPQAAAWGARTLKAGQWTKSAIQGAVADMAAFDGHEERLSNLVEQVPALKNPVTDYLAAKESDSQLKGRVKNALEGLGLGVFTEAVVKGVKAVKSARRVQEYLNPSPKKQALAQAGTDAPVKTEAEIAADFSKLGNVEEKRFIVPAEEKAKEAVGKIKPNTRVIEWKPDLFKTDENVAKQFKADVQNALASKAERVNVEMGKVPRLYTELGLPEQDLKTNKLALRKALGLLTPEELAKHKDWHNHNVPREVVDRLPELLADPLAVFRSNTKTGSYVAVLDAKVGDDPIVAILAPAPKDTGYTFIPTVYEHGKFEKFVESTANKNNIVYIDKSRTSLPEPLIQAGTIGNNVPTNSIITKDNFVKGPITAPKAAAAGNPSGQTYINFARIDTPDDVKKAMQELADADKANIDAARRGKQSFKEIQLNAEQQNAWEILASRRKGEPLNAEQSVAARRLWVASGERLTQLADLAAKNPSEENLFMFRKMLGIHNMVQQEVIAARTETARALASWKIPTGSSAEIHQQLGQLVQKNGGSKNLQQLAADITRMANGKQIQAMEELVEKTNRPDFWDMVLEYRTAALLTKATTHIVNMVSNAGTFAWDLTDRSISGRLNQWLGVENGVKAGEAWAQLKGGIGAFGDALRLAKKNWQTGQSAYGSGKIEVKQNAISSNATLFGKSVRDTAFGKVIDFTGFIVQTPFRALEASDEFFKTIAYRGEMRARALRTVEQEIASGKIKPAAKEARLEELVNTPTGALKVASMDKAEYLTFTNAPNSVAEAVQGLSRKLPIMKFFVPFVRTPANVWDFAFKHSVFAPLYSSVRADIAAGGARATEALGKMATGSMVMAFAADLAERGFITGGGPTSTQERNALKAMGWQPYSVKIGDKYYSYRRFDPLSTNLAMAADFVELCQRLDEDEEAELDELAVKLVFSTANSLMSTNFMMGLADLAEAVSDPTRYSGKYTSSAATSFIPNIVGSDVRNYMDPYQRETAGIMDALKNRTPGLSKDLPYRYDLFGRKTVTGSGKGIAYDAFVPVRVNPRTAEPIDKEILEQGVYLSMPPKKVNFDGVNINLTKQPKIYSRFVELAGNALTLPEYEDMGCKDYLNALVKGDSYASVLYEDMTDGADGEKANFIKKIVQDFRNAAKAQILEEYPTIARQVEAEKEAMLWGEK